MPDGPPNLFGPTFFASQHLIAAYEGWLAETEVEFYEGLLQIPVAMQPPADTSTPTVVLVRTHAPWGRKVTRFVAARVGEQPDVPHPRPSGGNMVLMSYRFKLLSPRLCPDGQTTKYEVRGEYVWALQVPERVEQQSTMMGGTPYDARSQKQFDQSHFRTDLTAASPPGLAPAGPGRVP